MSTPNRWLHVRLADGFSDKDWESFRVHCRVWRAWVEALLANWKGLGHDYEPPQYEFFPPELSPDRTIASLPIGGDWTVGSRATIENGLSYMLWCFMPIETQLKLEEGITEPDLVEPKRLVTNWRKALRPLHAEEEWSRRWLGGSGVA